MDKRPLPAAVTAAVARAEAADFSLSCEPDVGRLLAALVAAAPQGGRILEMGTGVGAGTAWIVEGAGRRSDLEVVSIEMDPATQAIAAGASWPPWVKLLQGDVLHHLPRLGQFDVIFADAQGGKWEGLEQTIAAVRSRGVLLVDDMAELDWWSDEQRRNQEQVRQTLLNHPELIAVELAAASGIILSAKR